MLYTLFRWRFFVCFFFPNFCLQKTLKVIVSVFHTLSRTHTVHFSMYIPVSSTAISVYHIYSLLSTLFFNFFYLSAFCLLVFFFLYHLLIIFDNISRYFSLCSNLKFIRNLWSFICLKYKPSASDTLRTQPIRHTEFADILQED